jgi:hypothetical protein
VSEHRRNRRTHTPMYAAGINEKERRERGGALRPHPARAAPHAALTGKRHPADGGREKRQKHKGRKDVPLGALQSAITDRQVVSWFSFVSAGLAPSAHTHRQQKTKKNNRPTAPTHPAPTRNNATR